MGVVSAVLPLTKRTIFWVLLAAFLAALAKVYCAWMTFGSNDVTTFYYFGKVIELGGLKAAYELGPIFNHPPLVGDFLLVIRWISRVSDIPFPFLLRLPAILADFTVIVCLLRASAKRPGLRLALPFWLVLALSPVSFMISGYHGNTDPVLVLGLVLAALMCCEERPILSGLFFALSLQIKVVGLIVGPIFFFYWLARRRLWHFSITCGVVLLLGWAEPLLVSPQLFLKNVLGYTTSWGFWGISYWLKMSHFTPFYGHALINPSGAERIVASALKALIVGSISLLAWRRRKLPGEQIFATLMLGWAIFFTFAPGVSPQYLVWPACFFLIGSPRWFLAITAASSLYQFFFYNAISGGMPWFYGVSQADLDPLSEPWSIWPWLVFAIGLYKFWRKAGSPRLLSLANAMADLHDSQSGGAGNSGKPTENPDQG